MSRQLQFDEIGGWSELKLEILKKYAAAYSTILSAQTKASLFHVYIYAFAGAGKHLSRATQEFVPGSPLNALAVQPQFREFHLIDIAPDKIENLRELIGPRKDVFIYQGDCNEILLKYVFPCVRYDREPGTSTRLVVYNWIKNQNGVAYVRDSRGNQARVGTREHANGVKFVQTYADRVWTDNLLAQSECR